MNDHEYFILLSKILIQIQKPLWSKDECYKSLCLEIDNSDFVAFVRFCKNKSWDYIKTICGHYYDCNQYVFCISYKELTELFPYESLDNVDEIESICLQAMSEQPQAVSDYKKGKTNAVNRIKGQVMKMTKGKINANIVDSTLTRLLTT